MEWLTCSTVCGKLKLNKIVVSAFALTQFHGKFI
jgi:hypothetical protein